MACATKDAKSKLAGQFSMFGDLMGEEESIKINYPNLNEYDNMEKLKREKEVCGIYISGSPLDAYMQTMLEYNFNSSMLSNEDEVDELEDEDSNNETLSEIKDGMNVDCGGIITNVHKIFTKQTNKPMAIITIEDIYGEFDAMIFNKMYETLEETLDTDKIVHISGRVSVRVGDKPIIIVSKLDYISGNNSSIETNLNTQTQKVFGGAEKKEEIKKIYLKLDLANKSLVDQTIEILQSYPGNSPVFVQYENKLYNINCFAEPANSLVAELGRFIGINNIKIK